MDRPPTPPSRGRRASAVLLLGLPVLGLVWVPAYAREEPVLLDVPFFYWYQLAWVGLSVLCLAGAALLLHPSHPHHRPGGSA